jgi:hypothetical protein
MTRKKTDASAEKKTRTSLEKLRKTKGRTNFARLYAEQAREKAEAADKKSKL